MTGEDSGDRFDPQKASDRIEVEDSGQTLEDALAEEEQSAIKMAEEKLQSVMHNLEELRDRHARKLAEFDNMRKRTEREKSSGGSTVFISVSAVSCRRCRTNAKNW